jgi:methionine synthase II (cobalamin-independent)
METNFNCLPTTIGSMPHKNPRLACDLIARYLKEIPAWPQLPCLSPNEGMVEQFSEGFPGLKTIDNHYEIDNESNIIPGIQAIYEAYIQDNAEAFPVSLQRASGFYEFLKLTNINPLAVKGQITGPISFGLSVKDTSGKAILYDETLSDAAAKLLRLKAFWQERRLKEISSRTIIFVDEPGMASYGSAFFNLSAEKVVALIDQVMDGIYGVRGIHCCGNTDWSVVMSTKAEILSFDTYNYAESLNIFSNDVKSLIGRGGAIAWGIVPNTQDLNKESIASLKDRLEEAMAPFTRQGIPFSLLKARAILTPACSLASLSEDGAEQALIMLTGLSARMRGEAIP